MAQRYCLFLRPPKKGLDAYSAGHKEPVLSLFESVAMQSADLRHQPSAISHLISAISFLSAGPKISPHPSAILLSAISFLSAGQNIKAIYDFCEISIPYFPNISLFADKMMNSLSVIVMM